MLNQCIIQGIVKLGVGNLKMKTKKEKYLKFEILSLRTPKGTCYC